MNVGKNYYNDIKSHETSTPSDEVEKICWSYTKKSIRNQDKKPNDNIKMGGYSASKKEFETTLRKITQLGYGIVLIAHNTTRIEKTANDSEVEIISPDLPKRAAEVCNGLVDIIGYIGNEYIDGENKRWLYTRETPTLFAGSRFKYLAPKIEFGYQQLVDAIAEAIDKAEKLDGVKVTEKAEIKNFDEKLDFKAERAKAQELWAKIVGKGETDEEKDRAAAVLKKIEMIMGRKMKLSEFTEDQTDLLHLVILDMEDML